MLVINKLDEGIINKIDAILSSQDDPFYLYNIKKIQHNCSQLIKIPYQPKAIHFAAMANDNPSFLRIIKRAGLNIFVNSTEHLKNALIIGFKDEQIIFAASAMSQTTMKQVYRSGAITILDSLNQVKLWFELCPSRKTGIRCNIGDMVDSKKTRGGYFIGKESRLGLNLKEIKELSGSRKISGLHIYVGTDILDIGYFLRCYKAVLSISRSFPALEYIDFGGGFGISETKRFDFAKYGEKIARIMNGFSDRMGGSIRLILEPGRIIGGEAGCFVAPVNDVKIRNNRQLIGVNASSAQFPRPLFYPEDARHPVRIIHRNKPAGLKRISTDIYGCSTYSRDYLAKNIMCEKVSIGDVVVFLNAGSYCASSFTSFLGFKKPKEYFYGS